MKQENRSVIQMSLDRLINYFQVVEFFSGFSPLLVMIVDIVAGGVTNKNFVDYEFFGSYLVVYGCLLLIALIAVLASLIKDQALGKDNCLSAYGLTLPKNTILLVQNSYARQMANRESVRLLLVYVVFHLAILFLLGLLVSIIIFKSYLFGYVNAS